LDKDEMNSVSIQRLQHCSANWRGTSVFQPLWWSIFLQALSIP